MISFEKRLHYRAPHAACDERHNKFTSTSRGVVLATRVFLMYEEKERKSKGEEQRGGATT